MTNPDWYRTSYRRNLVDMHIEDWNPELLSQFSAEKYYENLKTANVKSAMIYLQSHVGHCNWNTESGHKHQSFPNCEAEMRKLFDLCHQGNIDVVVYYSMIYNNDAYVAHPEWRLIDQWGHSTRFDNGKGQYFGGSRYGLCCPNNPGYRDFVLKQLDEIFDRFEFEGIFLDMTFWTRVCHCDSCKKRWAEEHGGDIPTKEDWNDPNWQTLMQKREDWMQEFCQMITDKVKSRNPNCAVEHQYSTMMHPWRMGINRNVSIASDYCGGDFYGGVPQHSVACKLYYNMTQNQPFEYMTSRCYPGLREHTTNKTMDMLEQSVMATVAHHGAVLLIDAIDPRGTLDARIYETYGKLYREAEKYEKYMEGEMVEDVGVLFNLEAKYDPACGSGMPHPEGVMGTCKILQQAHIPYGVFGDWHPEKMAKCKVLVLSDAYNLPDEVIDFVIKYVNDGGRVYASGRLTPRLFKALLGIEPAGAYKEPMVYMVPAQDDGSVFEYHTHDYPLAVTSEMQRLVGGEFDKVLATTALPFAVPEDTGELHPDALDGFDYTSKAARFVSIHSNPPGRWVDDPSLVMKTVGKGKVIYSAAPFEAYARPANGPLLVKLLTMLNEGQAPWSFGADAPEQCEIVSFRSPEKRRIQISLINCIEGFSVPSLSDITVRVQLPGPAKRVLALPDEKLLPWRQVGKTLEFKVEKLHICKIFAIDYE